MKTHTIAIVSFIAGALIVAAFLVTSRTSTTAPQDAKAGEPVLPRLAERINDSASIQVVRNGATSTYVRKDAGWVLAEKGDYPAKSENVRGLLIGLSQMRVVEQKTSKPELYARIGVQDPDSSDAKATRPTDEAATQPTRVTVKDAAGASLASIIIGTQKWGTTPEVYVRRDGEAASWLAAGRIDVPWDSLAWIDRTILTIARDKWKSATVTHPDGETITCARADTTQSSFFLENIPPGRQLSAPTAGDQLGFVFSGLTLDDVRPAAEVDAAHFASGIRTVGTTFDGLLVTARSIVQDGKTWAVIEAAAEKPAEQPETAKQADELNKRLSPWAFMIPEYKAKGLRLRWTDVLKPAEAAPPVTEAEPTDDESEPREDE